ncbi:hypothetical protein ACIP5N_21200 [Streptomyces sp. NPDC088768]|uniref:hypothetical protein n=1 Tax=Streptomyces sp. NPDC088768 TaxID=3365894 RepID=UPI0037F75B69
MTRSRTTLTPSVPQPRLPALPEILRRTFSAHAQDVAAAQERATHTVLGYTAQDRPLEALTVRGSGPDTVVIAVGAHPDEASDLAGSYLLDAFAHEPVLAAFTVHFVLCDPDGAALNAGREDTSLARYFSLTRFHRPAVAEQPALNLPLTAASADAGGPDLKATLALQQSLDTALDETARSGGRLFMFDLHRCPIGAVYATTLAPAPHLNRHLGAAAESVGLPLARVGWVTGDTLGAEVAPGVFPAPTPQAVSGSRARANAQRYVHARNPRAVTAVLEVPHFVRGPAPALPPAEEITRLVHGPAAVPGSDIVQLLNNTSRSLAAYTSQLPPLHSTPFGRAYASRAKHLTSLARAVDARTTGRSWAYMALLRQTAALARHAAASGSENPSPWEETAALHKRIVILAQRFTRAQAVPEQDAALAHARAVAVTLLGEEGLHLWPTPSSSSSSAVVGG